MRSCAAPRCNRKYAKGELYSWFKFPVDPVLRSQWLAAVGLNDIPKVSSSFICSEHFSEECFYSMRLNGLRMLKRGSVPSIFTSTCGTTRATKVPEVSSKTDESSPDVISISDVESLRGKRLCVARPKSSKHVKCGTVCFEDFDSENIASNIAGEEGMLVEGDSSHSTTDVAEQKIFEEVIVQTDGELKSSTSDAECPSPEVYKQTPLSTGNGHLEQPEDFEVFKSPSIVGSIQRYMLNFDHGYTRSIFDKNPRTKQGRENSASPVLEVVNVLTQNPAIFTAKTSSSLSCKLGCINDSLDVGENHYAMQEVVSTRDVGTSPPPSFSEESPTHVMSVNEGCELKMDNWENSDDFSEEEAATCPCTLKAENESVNTAPNRQRQAKYWKPRFVRSCTIEHLNTPEKAQLFLTRAKQESDEQKRRIKTLQQKNRRLTFRVENLEAIVIQLKKHITTIQAKKDMNNIGD